MTFASNATRRRFAIFIFCLAAFSVRPFPGTPTLRAETEAVPPAGIGPTGGESSEQLRGRIERVVESETRNLAAIREKLDGMTRAADEILSEFESMDLRTTARRNLFLLADTPLPELERAWADHVAARKTVGDFLAAAESNLRWIQEQEREVRSRAELYRADLEMRLARLGDAAEAAGPAEGLGRIDALLDRNMEVLGAARILYGERVVPKLREFAARLSGMSERFETRLRERRATDLFARGDSGATFVEDIRELMAPEMLLERARNTLDREIGALVRRLETVGVFFLFAFLLMFAAVEYGAVRGRIGCLRAEARRDWAGRPWGRLALRMFADGLPPLGATLFVYGYAQLRGLWITLEIFRIAFVILGLWLVTGWFLSFLKLRREMTPDGWLSDMEGTIRNLLRFFRGYVPIFVVFVWLMGQGVALQTTGRLIFDAILLIWLARFWKRFHERPGADPRTPSRLSLRAQTARWIAFFIPSVGIVLGLLGFFSLSLYWAVSWMLTFPILLWGSVLFMVLREWRRRFNAENAAAPAEIEHRPDRLLQWLSLQLSWLAWAGLSLPSLVFAWYVDKRSFFERAFGLMRAPLPVEGLRISIFGILAAILVILLTHVGVRVGAPRIRDRFLVDSGLNRGARTSITLIAVYGFWAMGILVALNVLGIQSGHLAVVFGALGLGLGFGLQNIFNNFVSGIILLFERPIQVGDVVEVNGLWAEVKNINVRATQVQTYDNATLLIPNSEFVSGTVVNWSFKDLRIRRNIYVGVAYGSDIERVRDTMLEIAKDAQYVLKYPPPLVYFSDFGDSALIFRLRFWTDVDNCLTAETNIRFAIDRLFRERGIEIAFPQRDIHIRTGASPALPPSVPDGEATFIPDRPAGPFDPPDEESTPESGPGENAISLP